MLNSLLAAFTLFTRLPLWRVRGLTHESFARAVEWWPAVGLMTGGIAAGALWCASMVLPAMAAVALALGARVLFTGAFHEDGLGDFFDGMGGGRTRERTLEIMKDSRTGTYGVVGLVLYYALAVALLAGLPARMAAVVLFVGDPLSKALAAQLTNVLPYARSDDDSKLGGAYRRMDAVGIVVCVVAGLVPAALSLPPVGWIAVAAPVLVFAGLCWLMRRRLGGYTGDCCGATFLLCEVSFWTGIWIVGL
jgi:adenosylcobinamide-GDP ribazoletransferase